MYWTKLTAINDTVKYNKVHLQLYLYNWSYKILIINLCKVIMHFIKTKWSKLIFNILKQIFVLI